MMRCDLQGNSRQLVPMVALGAQKCLIRRPLLLLQNHCSPLYPTGYGSWSSQAPGQAETGAELAGSLRKCHMLLRLVVVGALVHYDLLPRMPGYLTRPTLHLRLHPSPALSPCASVTSISELTQLYACEVKADVCGSGGGGKSHLSRAESAQVLQTGSNLTS